MTKIQILLEVQRRVFSGERIYAPVMSDSMEPSLIRSEICFIEKFPLSELSPGMIIAIIRDQIMIWHQFVRIEDQKIITSSLKSHHEDPPVMASMYIGRVFPAKATNRDQTYKSCIEFCYKILKPVKELIKALLIKFFSLFKYYSFARFFWSCLLDVVKFNVESLCKKKNIGIFHFHSRYANKEIIPGSSDVDLTIILPSTIDLNEANRLYQEVSHWASSAAKKIPLFDPPYIFFENALEDILATSIFMRKSFERDIQNTRLQSLINSIVINQSVHDQCFGLLDELFSIVRRYKKLTTSKYPFFFLKREKYYSELEKLIADLSLLSLAYEATVGQQTMVEVLSRKDLLKETTCSQSYKFEEKLFEVSCRILELPNFNCLRDNQIQNIEDLELKILECYNAFDEFNRPVTLHISQFLRT